MDLVTYCNDTNIIVFLILICIVIFLLTCLKKYLYGEKYNGKYRLDDKVVIITGANTGIGKEVAKDLARRGARVILACRNLVEANKAADEIKQITGGGQGCSTVIVKHLDLASLSSVRRFVKDIKNSEERLDILINNAGVYHCPYWKTEDGFEMQFGVNHLGHFLLTNLLLPLLKKSSQSRVITVSSEIYRRGIINFQDINSENAYDHKKSYMQSKLANILFSRELAKRVQGTGITTYSLNPGIVRTNITRYIWLQKPFLRPIFYLYLKAPLFKDAEYGAQTIIYCAVEKSLEYESGKYYSDCARKQLSGQALDDGLAKKLWEMSEQMVGLYNDVK